MSHNNFFFLIVMLFTATLSFAQESVPCSAAEYRQFDFWIGDWEVTAENTEGERKLVLYPSSNNRFSGFVSARGKARLAGNG